MAATNELQLRIKAISDFSDVQSNVQNIQQYLSKLNLPPNLKKNFEGLFGNFEKEASKFQKYLDGGLKSKGDITGLEKSGTQLSSMLKRLKTEVDKLQNENLTELFKGLDVTGIQKAEQKVEQLQNNLKELIAKTNLSELTKEFGSFGATIDGTFAKMSKSNSVQKFKEAFKSGDIKQMDVALTGLEAHLERYYKTKDGGKKSGYDSFENDITTLRKLKEELTKIPGANQLEIELREARQELERLTAENTQALENGLRESASGANMTAEGMERVTRETKEAASASRSMTSEIEQLKSQVSYFFGLTNSVMLFRRALTEALETVKELDAVMTEMSVVTDLNVGDYWDQLPEYSKRAKELGVSIKDAYSAATLYYQQGLKTNEVVAVSNETLKMARIAGMEAKEATDMMTAALRGFNMEINETSAQRINDVYSELAAVTASDTEEIATAMTKTASIAASANMEFETTSALLAQIIETTREAPETAGTAMKTIIARFTEVKELFSEGQLTGTDEEGEAININKIDAALKSVGMSLSGFLQGTQGIDDIFLELASKWDSLDIATQRYIATMAAGSRQQSRFLAMMSDYGRTMELVEAANNSSGASQEQFNKTLDSLETKLNKLSVAWDTFVMGIANNDLIKFGVDALTGLLNTINKIIDTASGGAGILKSFFSIGAVAAGLMLGKAAFNGIFKSIGAQMAVGAAEAGTKSGLAYSTAFSNVAGKHLNLFTFKKKFLSIFDADYAKYAGAQFAQLRGYYKENSASMIAMQKVSNTLTLQEKKNLRSKQLALGNLKISESEYMLLEKNHIAQDQLAIILSNEKSKKILLEGLAQKNLTKEQKRALVAEALLVAKKKMSLKQMITHYAMILFGAKLKKKDAKLTTKQAVANLFCEGSIKRLNKSQSKLLKLLASGTLGFYVLGIAAVIGVLALWGKAVEGVGEKEKRLKKQLEESQSAANELRTSYNELKSSLDELETKQDTFENLAKGTTEWKEALIEVNTQVLELLEKYPQLAQYLTNENGALTLDEDKTQEALEVMYDQVLQMQGGALAAQAQLVSLEDITDISYKNTEFTKFATRSGENGLGIERKGNYYSSTLGGSALINNYNPHLTEDARIAGKETRKMSRDLQIEGLIYSYLSSVNAEKINTDLYADSIAGAFSSLTTEDFTDRFKDERRKYLSMDKYTLRQEYKAKTGQEADESWTPRSLRDKLANFDVLDGVNQGMEDFYKSFSELNKSQQQHLIAAVTKGGEKYNKKLLEAYDIEKLKDGKISDSDIKDLQAQIMKQAGIADEAELLKIATDLGYDTIDEYIKSVAEGMVNASENYGQIFAQFGGYGETGEIQTLSENENLSMGALQGISDQLYDVFLTSGPQKAEELAGSVNKMMEGMSVEEAEAFATQLGDIDWSSVDSVEGLSEQLKSLGVSVDETQIEEFEKQIIDFADAADNLTFEEAKADMKELKELSEAMADQEGYVFTEELKDQLINSGKANADDFVMTGIDEWVYIGGSMEELLKSIEGDTNAILGELAGSLEGRVAKGAKWNQIRNRGMTVGDTFYTDTTKAAEDIINGVTGATKEEMVQILEAAGVTINNVDQLTEQHVRDLLEKEYANYGFGGSTYEQNLAEQKAIAASAVATDRFVIEYGDEGATTPYEAFGYSKQEEFEKNKVFNPEEIEAVKNGLIAQAKQYGVAEEKIEAFTENVLDSEGALNDEAVALLENEIERKRSIKATKDHIEAINEVVDGYTKASQMTEEDKVKLADMFGLSELSENDKIAFVNDNFNAITQYANGSYEAVKQLTDEYLRLLTQDTHFEVKVDTKTGEVDISSLLAAIEAGGDAALEAQAIIDQLIDSNLFEIEYKKVKAYTEEPKIESWTSYGVPIYSKDKSRRYYWSEVPVIKRKGQSTFGEGFKGSGGSKGGGGGGGSEATNDYDRHYNLDQDINAELREREKLEKEYQDLLEKRHASGKELHKITLDELASLERQKELQEEMLKRRKEDLKRTLKENSQYSEYAKYNYEDQTIEINWDKLEALAKSNPDKYEEVSEFISELEEEQGYIQDCEDAIYDTEDAIYEVNERGKDAYTDLYDRTIEALITLDEKLIEEQEKINDSINDAASDLMDAIQSNIDKFRQDRDNKKTEESIAEKERRLAYLRQDTSGSNAMEIKKLEEELADEKESYGDTLIDQAMENLQEQNDAAAEQRERQIKLQEEQVNWAKDNGKYNAEALDLLNNGILNGHIDENSKLYEVLSRAEGVNGMHELDKEEWFDTLQQTVSEAYVYAMTMSTDTDYMAEMLKQFEKNGGVVDAEILRLNALRNLKIAITGEGTPISDEDIGSELNIRTPKKGYMAAIQERYASNGGVIDDDIRKWNAARNEKIRSTPGSTQRTYTDEELEEFLKSGGNNGGNTQADTKVEDPKPPVQPTETKKGNNKIASLPNKVGLNESQIRALQEGINDLITDGLLSGTKLVTDGKMGPKTKEMIRKLQTKLGVTPDGDWGPNTYAAFHRSSLKAYKTGGLANFTGPAWLDGTKSKPELVLNARDTENFILLKDVLSSLLHLPKNNQNSAPNSNYFDIDVKVDEIGNDYDVDRMIDRVKEKIYEDSMYRNVNSINLLR